MWLKIYENQHKICIIHGGLYSISGAVWVETTMPVKAKWRSIVNANNMFVAIAEKLNVYSSAAGFVTASSLRVRTSLLFVTASSLFARKSSLGARTSSLL
ncbi:MAG: hypothetical protein LBD76_03655 [Prevotellaceae bacterium]|nr:hypothetical protein [Prevotellaceae bacterium]